MNKGLHPGKKIVEIVMLAPKNFSNYFLAVFTSSDKMLRRKSILLAFSALLFCLPKYAYAACTPLKQIRSEPSFLEQLVKHTPKDRRLSDEELMALLRAGEIKLPPFVVFPPNGPAPLTVDIHWSAISDSGPLLIEFDAEGNGSFRSIKGRFDANSGIHEAKFQNTYEHAATYQPTLRVRDNKGNVVTHKREVIVRSKAQFETELQNTWADFKMALRNRDIAAALNCTHFSARDEYTKILPKVLKSQVPIDEILTDIQFVNITGSYADFKMVRKEGNDLISYTVEFMLDDDGLWRIQSF
jgi:hypothetical protein